VTRAWISPAQITSWRIGPPGVGASLLPTITTINTSTTDIIHIHVLSYPLSMLATEFVNQLNRLRATVQDLLVMS
jgi:hypothetical protein